LVGVDRAAPMSDSASKMAANLRPRMASLRENRDVPAWRGEEGLPLVNERATGRQRDET
jgi:hypothetical protein